MTNEVSRPGSIPAAMAWMVGLSALLFWLPFFGPLIAGYVGGSRAGSVSRAVIAVFLPSIILTVATFLLGTVLGGIPVLGSLLGMVAGLGLIAKGMLHVVPLLIGAVVGARWGAEA